MGDGEFVGNGSVEWRVVHEADGNAKALTHTNAGGRPGADQVRVGNANHLDAEGHDPIAFADIGRKHQNPGFFKVIMRFPTAAAAEAACGSAKNVVERGGKYFLEVLVPAINRQNPNADRPAEVKVEW